MGLISQLTGAHKWVPFRFGYTYGLRQSETLSNAIRALPNPSQSTKRISQPGPLQFCRDQSFLASILHHFKSSRSEALLAHSVAAPHTFEYKQGDRGSRSVTNRWPTLQHDRHGMDIGQRRRRRDGRDPPWFHMNRAKHNVIVTTGE